MGLPVKSQQLVICSYVVSGFVVSLAKLDKIFFGGAVKYPLGHT